MTKTIIINNEKDYKKLLSKLKYYKYYKFTDFNIVNNIKNEDIDMINEALNIKYTESMTVALAHLINDYSM